MSTVFEPISNPMENASMMLAGLRGELERVGLVQEALTLKGLEVTGPTTLHVALMTVRQIEVGGEMATLRRYVLDALVAAEESLTPSSPRLAS